MPRAVNPITNVTAGELSPLLHGRADLSKFYNGGQTVLNFRPRPQGPLSRRPGTYYVSETEDMSEASRLIEFIFGVTQPYVLLFGDQKFRILKDRGIVTNTAGAVEITTPWLEADLFQLKTAQSADFLYVTHPSYQPRTVTRSSDVAWTVAAMTFSDGPYLPVNTTATTLTPSGGSYAPGDTPTVTASAVTGINGGDGFQATDVGRVLRIKNSSNWAWGTIATRSSTTVVTVTVGGTISFPSAAEDEWRLGVWSDTTGWPSCVTFFEDRLCFAGPTDNPQRVDMSVSGDYTNFAPTAADGTVAADNAIAVTLNANQVNAIRWILDDEKGLLIGTTGGEWILRASSTGESLTPTNANARQPTNYGSADVQPVRAGPAVLYLQRAARKVRELAYSFEADGFRSPDMTILAEHITGAGLIEFAYQKNPDSGVWSPRTDGTLDLFTYERDQDVVGWTRHVLGGVSDANGTQAKVESVAVIPSPDGSTDDVWVIVQRYIDGGVVRYVEYLTPSLDDPNIAKEDGIYMDSALTYDGSATMSVSGADHLEGQTVRILADGASHPDAVVSSGAVTLQVSASVVQLGLPYTSTYKSMPLEGGSQDGTAQTRTKRVDRVGLRLYRSLGGKGIGGNSVDELIRDANFRFPSTPMGDAPGLFTGDIPISWPGGYETDGAITIETSDQFPLTFSLAVVFARSYDR